MWGRARPDAGMPSGGRVPLFKWLDLAKHVCRAQHAAPLLNPLPDHRLPCKPFKFNGMQEPHLPEKATHGGFGTQWGHATLWWGEC
jgi:hypothetical protein